MEEQKQIIAENIAALRQARAMTQLELAEQLNYSDKAVSKWERAESIPDVFVLISIAKLFGVTLDTLVTKQDREKILKEAEAEQKPGHRKSPIVGMAILLVWLIAVAAFSVLLSVEGTGFPAWLVFVYALPVSAIVWLVLNSVWFDCRMNYFIVSLLLWSALASLFLTLLWYGYPLWQTFLPGIPGQAIICLWSRVKKSPGK